MLTVSSGCRSFCRRPEQKFAAGGTLDRPKGPLGVNR